MNVPMIIVIRNPDVGTTKLFVMMKINVPKISVIPIPDVIMYPMNVCVMILMNVPMIDVILMLVVLIWK